ncbi:Fic family protein [Vibrio mangrovi]|uniref:Fic family protein n=1 Tax=Vibrio mangrovi TaxID=474394 RepID=A0A1Y6J2L0_9VIBR|nr:Fic family protein [Vibrio mangrovi]MDW6005316.1 Fic family protein [Vibrio mangrovi]SMS02942.1 Fic/DOC family protein [Vibrio mangrovi]
MFTESKWGMKPNIPLAKQLAKRDVPALVYDAVNLEGVAMTLPEVQTILDGITVGGHRISDQNMAMNQAKTWMRIFELVDSGEFFFNKETALLLHNIAGEEEALEWGKFRSGYVSITGSEYEPPAPQELDEKWDEVQSLVESYEDIYDRAITAFLQMARVQFFWDVNKRTGRFMMNGILLSCGFPIINVPAKRQQEFNTLMLDFYASNDMEPMNKFLRSCIDERIIKNFQLDLKIGGSTGQKQSS